MLLLALLTTSALAFQTLDSSEGTALQWAEMPVYYSIDATLAPQELGADETSAAIRAGLQAWNHVELSSAELVEGEPTAWDRQESGDVFWVEDWEWDADVLALTSTWSTTSGEIVAFEIAINASPDTPWTLTGSDEGWDLQNTIAHEAGHVLGLAHNEDDRETTMYPTASKGETLKRDLALDDKDGVTYLYPWSEGQGGLDLAELGCSTTGGPAPWAALLLPLLALARRRTS